MSKFFSVFAATVVFALGCSLSACQPMEHTNKQAETSSAPSANTANTTAPTSQSS